MLRSKGVLHIETEFNHKDRKEQIDPAGHHSAWQNDKSYRTIYSMTS